MRISCDNVTTCGGSLTYAGDTYARARVKGWHIYEGPINGVHVVSALCPACVGQRGRREPPPPVLEGQESLFGSCDEECPSWCSGNYPECKKA